MTLTVDDRELIEACKAATRFNSPDREPGFRRVGFILPESIAWTNDKTGFDVPTTILSLLSERDKLEALAAKLVAKLDECAPHVANMSVTQFVRSGVQYTGPSYGEALAELRAALTQTEVP